MGLPNLGGRLGRIGRSPVVQHSWFALGALFALVVVKGLRFIRTKLLDNPR
jgi:hypothetical protein